MAKKKITIDPQIVLDLIAALQPLADLAASIDHDDKSGYAPRGEYRLYRFRGDPVTISLSNCTAAAAAIAAAQDAINGNVG